MNNNQRNIRAAAPGDHAFATTQNDLPKLVPLVRHVPDRSRFDWKQFDPDAVLVASDLPPYLIMGWLDKASFERTTAGWQATWRAPAPGDAWLRIQFDAATRHYALQQSWNGVDGGFSQCWAEKCTLDQAIGQWLYMRFPSSWDTAAANGLEAQYQLSYVPQPAKARAYVGIPDGAFRTIAFIAQARNLRAIRNWLREVLHTTRPAFPVTAEARLLMQVVNHVEGKAPSWTTDAPRCFHQSVLDTGLAPVAMPVREQAADGSAAWTVRRPAYAIFINVPFAGLEHFLAAILSSNGPVRAVEAEALRPEFRPVIFPLGLETHTAALSTWNPERTTRCTLAFPKVSVMDPLAVAWAHDADATAERDIATIERVSAEVVGRVEAEMGLEARGE